MKTVAVSGVGLIGGSFALALRKAGFTGRILGVSSPRTIAKALELGVIDAGATMEEAASNANLIYLAQPISGILETLDTLSTEALVTDAGSTKSAIVDRGKRLPNFVGGHPMAGKESRGVESADADLFQGRPYVLTSPHPELQDWISRIGARVVILSAEDHDRLVALTSHLPQLLSTALASCLGDQPEAARVAGPAALDLTRLALSPYEIWRDILATNATRIDEALETFIAKLEGMRSELRGSRVEQEFERAAAAARELRRRP